MQRFSRILARPVVGRRSLGSSTIKLQESKDIKPIDIAAGITEKENLHHPVVKTTDDALRAKLATNGQYIQQCCPKYVEKVEITHANQLEIMINPAGIVPFMHFLKTNSLCRYNNQIDFTVVDMPTRRYRFELVWNLLSIDYNARIRIKSYTDESTPVESLCGVFANSDWLEREVFDMYGVYFNNHPDLRRILTDYGFTGHPLRKDFPLSGYYEVRYDQSTGHIVQEPVELAQEWRRFDLTNPWETFPNFRENVNHSLPAETKQE